MEMECRFKDLVGSPFFNLLVPILDVNIWPKNQEQFCMYCNTEIETLQDYFQALWDLNQCMISSVHNKWDGLKVFIQLRITGIKLISDLGICSKIFSNKATFHLRSCLAVLIASKRLSK